MLKARRIAPRTIPVLIEGESGTGKELLARAIHKTSPRKDMPFISINCGAIPAELVESELFGHEKGTFTGADTIRIGHFEAAHQGNLFRHPYTKIAYLQNDLQISRITATKYLTQLTEKVFLTKAKIGRYNYYINEPLMNLFMDIPEM